MSANRFIAEALEARCLLSAPTQFVSRGPGGGGAFFSPSFSPFNANEIYTVSDMSGLYHSTNLGQSWGLTDFRQFQGNRTSQVQYTSDSNVLYGLDADDLSGTVGPRKSVDGGKTWTALGGWTFGDAYTVYADPNNTTNLVVSDFGDLYFSNNGGTSFVKKFTAPGTSPTLYVAGAFFDGAGNIYLGTSAGLVVSNNNGVSFALSAVGGITAGQSMFSFAGAQHGGTTRLFCTTLNAADVFPGVMIEGVDASSYSGVWSIDVGQANWALKTNGIPAAETPHFVSMARNNINTVYVAGTNSNGSPTVSKSVDGGANWSGVLNTVGNGNVATGWQGQGGDRGWGFSETALGFEVSPVDPNTLAFTDLGFLHLSTDGGATWRQAYVNPADQNAAGTNTPPHKAYRGVGLEDTSALWMTWADTNTIVAGYTDIYGVRSTDGGNSWAFPTNISLANNTVYQVSTLVTNAVASGEILYGATSGTHDIYQSTHLTNASLDSGNGKIIFSIDKGNTWATLHDFGHPVVYTALDPTNPNRMFASVISSTVGGVYVTNNLNAGTGSTWTKVTNPPRTEGHPYNLVVLSDGTLVATYSAHRNPNFTASSGVFISGNQGTTWTDRTLMGASGQPGMQYWTKDICIDPTDATQNTWYVAVRGGFGGDGSSNGKGGLYKTTNRGVNWTRVFSADSAESCTINAATGDLYVSTTDSGLWTSSNFNTATPTFTQVTSYLFRQPERIFVNPFNTSEVWVTSFGYGLAKSVSAASVAGRHLFYNNSFFDGFNTTSDDGAIAPDKSALLPGQTATFANYTSYTSGINGVMVDIANLPPSNTLTAADFTFKVGNSNDSSTWTAAPAPASITIRRGAGDGGSDRVELIWTDGAIQKEWLAVTTLADANTGLAANDVFYFGNAVGEEGDRTSDAFVDGSDFAGARDDFHSFANRAALTNAHDYNRDSFVDGSDLAAARDNNTNFVTALKLITVPPVTPAASAIVAAGPSTLNSVTRITVNGVSAASNEVRWAPIVTRKRRQTLRVNLFRSASLF